MLANWVAPSTIHVLFIQNGNIIKLYSLLSPTWASFADCCLLSIIRYSRSIYILFTKHHILAFRWYMATVCIDFSPQKVSQNHYVAISPRIKRNQTFYSLHTYTYTIPLSGVWVCVCVCTSIFVVLLFILPHFTLLASNIKLPSKSVPFIHPYFAHIRECSGHLGEYKMKYFPFQFPFCSHWLSKRESDPFVHKNSSKSSV